jgi:hypothetical protein
MATEVTKFRGGDHTTKLHHTIYSLRHTAIRNAHDTVRGSGLISSISPRMRALFPAWSSADHLVNSSGLSKNVRLSPSIVIDKFDDCGSCLLTLYPVARSVMMPPVTWVATECARSAHVAVTLALIAGGRCTSRCALSAPVEASHGSIWRAGGARLRRASSRVSDLLVARRPGSSPKIHIRRAPAPLLSRTMEQPPLSSMSQGGGKRCGWFCIGENPGTAATARSTA